VEPEPPAPKFLPQVGFWFDPPANEDLPHPQDFVDPDWDPRERRRVARYLRRGDVAGSCMGFSWCRFRCGIANREMGCRTLSDGHWVWPEGFAHYVTEHAVKPPEEFLVHVRHELEKRPWARLRHALRPRRS
jgi:hypothetical protein